MSVDYEARLERLLARHGDIVLAESTHGAATLHRRDQILVPLHQADRAHQAAEQWTEQREDLPEVGVTRLRLRAGSGVDLPELAMQLRNHSDGTITASLNHMLQAAPDYGGGPFSLPQPAAAVPKPAGESTQGRRPLAAILDTGIIKHPWFADTDWFALVTPDQLDPIPTGSHYEPDAQTGHGTFVAGVLLRQAPGAFLMIERVLDDDGLCDELHLLRKLASLHRRINAAGETLDVLNMSLGGYTFDDRPSPLVSDALAKFGKHTVVVTAAGNDGADRPFWPAALKSCVAVAALETDDRLAGYSNRGWWVDACSVGTDVTGPFITDTTPDGRKFNGYAQWSGTSFAAPRVAGAVANLIASKQLSASEAVDLLLDPATRPTRPEYGVVVE
ncbi:MAG: S8 family peptidase [Actinocrinis sp.]